MLPQSHGSDGTQGFVSFFQNIKREPSLVCLFEKNNGEFYYAYGVDAEYIAKEFYRTTSVLKSHGSLTSCTLSRAAFESFLRAAVTHLRRRIRVYAVQDGRRNPNSWTIVREASAGNRLQVEDILDSAQARAGEGAEDRRADSGAANTTSANSAEALCDPVIAGVVVGPGSLGASYTVGVGIADAAARELRYTEFIDDELLTGLESLLVQLNVLECATIESKASLAESNDSAKSFSRLSTVLQNARVACTPVPKNTATPFDLASLNSLLRTPLVELPNHQFALSALHAIACYLGLVSGPSGTQKYAVPAYSNCFGIQEQSRHQYARLDAHALTALSVFGPGTRQPSHIFGLLNKCVTPAGSRLLAAWLRQPLQDVEAINSRLNCVAELLQDATVLDFCRSTLQKISDITRIARRVRRYASSNSTSQGISAFSVSSQTSAISDCAMILAFYILIPEFQSIFSPRNHSIPALCERFSSVLASAELALRPLANEINNAIVVDPDTKECRMRAEPGSQLERVERKLKSLRNEIESELEAAAEYLRVEPHKTLKLESNQNAGNSTKAPSTRFTFRLALGSANLLRQEREKTKSRFAFTEISTLKSGVQFTSTNLSQLAIDYEKTESEVGQLQAAALRVLMKQVAAYEHTLVEAAHLLCDLDVLCAFAEASRTARVPFVRPEVVNNKARSDDLANDPTVPPPTLELIGCRHPCVEVQEGVDFISNNVLMGRESTGFGSFIIITGPNMGGKSTYIRSVGVVALMAQIGCFVPCDVAKVPVFDAIMCRVGAADNQMGGVSTFMAEMIETAAILRTATDRSLVIIDELGRGTSTSDGFGIAYAVSQYLCTKVQPFALFATHFHEMTALAAREPCARNMHVVADASARSDDITLLYRVADGPCNQSFGIRVAEMAGLSSDIVAMARMKAENLERPHQALLAALREHQFASRSADADDLLDEAHRIIDEVIAEFAAVGSDAHRVDQLQEKYKGKVLSNPFLYSLMGQLAPGFLSSSKNI